MRFFAVFRGRLSFFASSDDTSFANQIYDTVQLGIMD